MADNTVLNAGAGGDTIREIEKAGAKTQVILLDVGGLGVESLFSGAVTITSGTISLPVGASTSALQTTGNTSLGNIDTKTPALGQALAAGSIPVVLTAAQLATLTPLATVAVTVASLPLPANAAQETGGNLAALNTVLGTTADQVKRPDESGSLEARLLYLSEQMAELIDVQKTSQELLFRNLVALEAISRQQPYEVN